MNTFRTITNLRGEVEMLTAERDAARAEVAQLRAQLAEFVSAYNAYIDAPIDQSTAWMDAIERLDALRDAIVTPTATIEAR